jgi:hypothetical protein
MWPALLYYSTLGVSPTCTMPTYVRPEARRYGPFVSQPTLRVTPNPKGRACSVIVRLAVDLDAFVPPCLGFTEIHEQFDMSERAEAAIAEDSHGVGIASYRTYLERSQALLCSLTYHRFDQSTTDALPSTGHGNHNRLEFPFSTVNKQTCKTHDGLAVHRYPRSGPAPISYELIEVGSWIVSPDLR